MTKAVATKTEKLPENYADDFGEYANAGMENVAASDLLVPRLSILQDLSPQLKKNKAEYIPGAEIGQIVDVGTGELFPDGIVFLPIYYRKDYLEWAPRSSGKGLVNVHNDPSILEQCKLNEKRQPFLPNGNYVSETAQFFGMNVTADFRKCFIPMASTQLKKARKWMTIATSEKVRRPDGTTFTPPLFYRTYQLSTAIESNNEGEWYSWVVERSVSLPEIVKLYEVDWQDIKAEAIRFLEQLKSGEAKADESHLATEQQSGDNAAM